MAILAFFLAIAFAAFVSLYVAQRAIRRNVTSLLDWTLLAIAGTYGIGWASVIFSFGTIDGYYWEPWLEGTQGIWPLHTLLALMLVLGIIFGWHISLGKRKQYKALQIRSSVLAWVLLGVAVVAQVLYSRAHGGLWALTQDAAALAIRSGLSQTVNPFSFLQPFGLFSAMATFLFFGLLLQQKSTERTIGFLISAVFSAYVYYTLFGRLDFLVFILSLVLARALYANSSAVGLIVRGMILMAGVVLLAFFLSAYFEVKSSESISLFFFNEFSFPFASFVSIINAAEVQYYFFRDFLFLPVYLLPSSFYADYFPLVSAQNTYLVVGSERGTVGVTGGIPVDLLSLGYYQLGVIGVPLTGVVWGFVLRKLQRFLDRIEPKGIRATLTSYISLKVAIFGVLYTQPEHIVTRNFALIATLFLVWLVAKLKWRR